MFLHQKKNYLINSNCDNLCLVKGILYIGEMRTCQSGEEIEDFEIFIYPLENQLAQQFCIKFNLLLFFLIS